MTAEPDRITLEASINAVRAKLDSDGMLVCTFGVSFVVDRGAEDVVGRLARLTRQLITIDLTTIQLPMRFDEAVGQALTEALHRAADGQLVADPDTGEVLGTVRAGTP